MSVVLAIFLAIHLLGMATIVGLFIAQMRAKSGFRTGLLLGGAITQLVSGVVLFGVAESQFESFDTTKYTVHAIVALVILAAAIVALIVQRKGGRVQPWFHTAGGLAVINVLIAVLWRQY